MKRLDYAGKVALVENLVEGYQKLYKVTDCIAQGQQQDDACRNIWKAFFGYCRAVELLLDDKHSRLSWWVINNNCGKAGLKLGSRTSRPKLIPTAKALVNFIEGK